MPSAPPRTHWSQSASSCTVNVTTEGGGSIGGRDLGEPGAVYGSADASTLTLGSGSSGNLTCSDAGPPAGQLVGDGIPGAGIVAVFAADVIVSGGAIIATPNDATRDVASSGGYVYLRATHVDLGTGRVTARGGIAHGQSATAGQTNPAGDGYVVVRASGTVAGTSDPAASRP